MKNITKLFFMGATTLMQKGGRQKHNTNPVSKRRTNILQR
jgi:hypothetical protein